MGDPFFTTVIFGWRRSEFHIGVRRACAGFAEKFFHPFGEVAVGGSIGYDGDVVTGVGGVGEIGNGLGVEIFHGVGRDRVERGAETTVESEGVHGVEGEGVWGGEDGFAREGHDVEDLFVEFVGWDILVLLLSTKCRRAHTGISCFGNDFSEQLGEVR